MHRDSRTSSLAKTGKDLSVRHIAAEGSANKISADPTILTLPKIDCADASPQPISRRSIRSAWRVHAAFAGVGAIAAPIMLTAFAIAEKLIFSNPVPPNAKAYLQIAVLGGSISWAILGYLWSLSTTRSPLNTDANTTRLKQLVDVFE